MGSAPAEIIVQGGRDLFSGRIGVKIEQSRSVDDHSGCTESAAKGRMFYECLLKRREVAYGPQSFDGDDLLSGRGILDLNLAENMLRIRPRRIQI